MTVKTLVRFIMQHIIRFFIIQQNFWLILYNYWYSNCGGQDQLSDTNKSSYWSPQTPIIVLLLFCDKRLVDIGMEDKKCQWLVSPDKVLKDTEKDLTSFLDFSIPDRVFDGKLFESRITNLKSRSFYNISYSSTISAVRAQYQY